MIAVAACASTREWYWEVAVLQIGTGIVPVLMSLASCFDFLRTIAVVPYCLSVGVHWQKHIQD